MATPATKHPAVVDVTTARAELLRFLENASTNELADSLRELHEVMGRAGVLFPEPYRDQLRQWMTGITEVLETQDAERWARARAAIATLLDQRSACRPSQPRGEWHSRRSDSLNHPGDEFVIHYGDIEAVVHSNSMREVPGSSGHECAFTIYAEPQRPPGADGTCYGRSILASGSVWSSHDAPAAARRMAELVIEGHLARTQRPLDDRDMYVIDDWNVDPRDANGHEPQHGCRVVLRDDWFPTREEALARRDTLIGRPRRESFSRWLPSLPAGWAWRADDVSWMLPPGERPYYLWRATEDDGDGEVYFDGTDAIKGTAVDTSASIAYADELYVVKRCVIAANRDVIQQIKLAREAEEGAQAR